MFESGTSRTRTPPQGKPDTTLHVLSQQLGRAEGETRAGVSIFDGFADCGLLCDAVIECDDGFDEDAAACL